MFLNGQIENKTGERWKKGTLIVLRVTPDPKSTNLGFAPAFFKEDKYLANKSSIRVFRMSNIHKFELFDKEDYEIETGRINVVPAKKTKRDQSYIYVNCEIVRKIETTSWRVDLTNNIAIENIRSGESYVTTGEKVPLTHELKLFRYPKIEKLIHVVVVKFQTKKGELIKMRVIGSETFDHHASNMISVWKGFSINSIMKRIKSLPVLPDDEILYQEANKFKSDIIHEPQKIMFF